MIDFSGVKKNIGKHQILRDINFTIEKGEAVGFIGPNGSGKTTTLYTLFKLISIDAGKISCKISNKEMGVSLDSSGFINGLSGYHNLKILAKLRNVGNSEIIDLINRVDLYKHRNKSVKKYSVGMKKRLSIASALLGDSKVYVFDEPTNGLDFEGVKWFRELIANLKQQGKTIILVSHILEELEKACDRFIFIKNGEIILISSKSEILAKYKSVENSYNSLFL